jgi:hypothetical protein
MINVNSPDGGRLGVDTMGKALDMVKDVALTAASSGALGPWGVVGAAAFKALEDGKLTAGDLKHGLTAAGVPPQFADMAGSLAQQVIDGQLNEEAFISGLSRIGGEQVQKLMQSAMTRMLGGNTTTTAVASAATSAGPLV